MNIAFTENTHPGTLPPSDQLGFGSIFTDHMFLMDYSAGKGWHDARIVPYGPISLSPAASVLHYGTEVFEGLKAYRRPDGGVQLFRPWKVALSSSVSGSSTTSSTPFAPMTHGTPAKRPVSPYSPVSSALAGRMTFSSCSTA